MSRLFEELKSRRKFAPGLTKVLRAAKSIAGDKRLWETEYAQDINKEKSAFAPTNFISKGTITSTLGGIFQLKDITGATTLLSYDPTTGTVTVAGGISVTQTLSGGTISNSTLMGAITLGGEITGGTVSAVTFNLGTVTNVVFSGGTAINLSIGSSAITGGTINNTSLGTPNIVGGAANMNSYQINSVSGINATAAIAATTGVTHTLTFKGGLLTAYATA